MIYLAVNRLIHTLFFFFNKIRLKKAQKKSPDPVILPH